MDNVFCSPFHTPNTNLRFFPSRIGSSSRMATSKQMPSATTNQIPLETNSWLLINLCYLSNSDLSRSCKQLLSAIKVLCVQTCMCSMRNICPKYCKLPGLHCTNNQLVAIGRWESTQGFLQHIFQWYIILEVGCWFGCREITPSKYSPFIRAFWFYDCKTLTSTTNQ